MKRQCVHYTNRGAGSQRCRNVTAETAVYCPKHGGPPAGAMPRTTCPDCGRSVSFNPVTKMLGSHSDQPGSGYSVCPAVNRQCRQGPVISA